jgi:hypothetical protein
MQPNQRASRPRDTSFAAPLGNSGAMLFSALETARQ